MVKEIQLTQGKVALVDDWNFDRLNKYNWYARKCKNDNTHYAIRTTTDGTKIFMHREVLNLKPFKENKIDVDHINKIGSDNREINLRTCTRSENLVNSKKQTNNTSGYIGVCWHNQNENWIAFIHKNRKQIHIGSFENKEDAARAYDKKARELFGEFVHLNFPDIK